MNKRRSTLAVILTILALSGACAHHKGLRFSARDVISWAQLDNALGQHLDSIACGEADGRAILGDYVMVLNGREMVDFVKAHGYRGSHGPTATRKLRTALEVDVEITGNDGAKMTVTLQSDGTMQGVG